MRLLRFSHRRAWRHGLAANLAAVLIALLAAVPALAAPRPAYSSLDELEGSTIAYINGSVYALAVEERIDGTSEAYYPSLPDCIVAVESGKAAAACGISYCCELAVNRSNGGVAMLPERVSDVEEAFFFKKGSPLTAQFNEVLARLDADGTLDALQAKWVSADDSGKTLPEQDWDAPNGTLRFATTGVLEPFSYSGPDGRPYGYDVELAMLIARELGYHIEIQLLGMDSIFAAVDAGKVDFGGSLTVTPERLEMVDFSNSVMDVGISLIVKADGDAPAAEAPEFTTLAELSGKRFGTQVGSVFDQYVYAYIDNPGEVLTFTNSSDQVAGLKAGRIDAFLTDRPLADRMVVRNSGIAIVPETVEFCEYGFFFAKGSSLVEPFNEVLERFWEDGTIDALREKWIFLSEGDNPTIVEQDWDAPNGTLVFATTSAYEPMSYLGSDGIIVGYDVELALLAARELGYHVEIASYTPDGVIVAVQSGKADFGGTGTTITEERAKIVDFSTPIYHGSVVAVVRAVGGGDVAQPGFFESLGESFERTFITEGRWKMVLSGLGVTALITLAAAAAGAAIGFGLTFLRRGRPWAERLVGGFQVLMGGLPIVVVLMILYYVVLGSLDISGVIVAIIGFALSFGATASSNIWNSVMAIDKGQDEAALALGYDQAQSFKKVVLPQAARQYLPLLLGQAITLVKETSIVGYIAVQDLTRASDLIRSRTMEAFFPLIATAVIYFIACWVIRRIGTRLIEKRDPEKRPRTIEGVRL